MKTIFSTLFICTAVAVVAIFGFEYLGDREAIKAALETCGEAGVYDFDTTGRGAWVTCNDPYYLEDTGYVLELSESFAEEGTEESTSEEAGDETAGE